MKYFFYANDPTACASHDNPSVITVEKRRHQSVTVFEEVLR